MTTPVTEKYRVFARPVAVRLGGTLLIGFVVALGAAAADHARRAKLETYQQVSGVEDRTYFQLSPGESDSPNAVITFQGQTIVPVRSEPIEIRDTRMQRLGKDDSGRYSVYRSTEPMPEEEMSSQGNTAQSFLFLKVAQDRYLRMQAGTPVN